MVLLQYNMFWFIYVYICIYIYIYIYIYIHIFVLFFFALLEWIERCEVIGVER